MTHRIILSEKQFSEHFQQLALMGLNIDDMVIVKHVVGSTKINHIEGTSSPSDYWKTHFNEPIEPSDKICTSCMKKSEQFVVGHVENKEQTKCGYIPYVKTVIKNIRAKMPIFFFMLAKTN